MHFCKANIPALSPTCSDLCKTVFNTLLPSYVLSRHSENENLPCVVVFSLFFFFFTRGLLFFCVRDVSPAGSVKHFSRLDFIFLPSVWLYTVAAVFCSLFSSIVPQCARCVPLYEAPLTSLHQRYTEFLPPWSACERIWHATQTLTLRRGNAGGFVPRVPFLSPFSYKCKFCVWALEQVCMCPPGLRQLLETYRGGGFFGLFFFHAS